MKGNTNIHMPNYLRLHQTRKEEEFLIESAPMMIFEDWHDQKVFQVKGRTRDRLQYCSAEQKET